MGWRAVVKRVTGWFARRWEWVVLTVGLVAVMLGLRNRRAERNRAQNRRFVDAVESTGQQRDEVVAEAAAEAVKAADVALREEVVRNEREAYPLERAETPTDVADEINKLMEWK